MKTLEIRTEQRSQLLPITDQVERIVTDSRVSTGVCTLYVPHTTAAITVNENADQDVARDILMAVDEWIPQQHPGFRHAEGNSDSHIKACYFGVSESLLSQSSRLVLGTWQGVYFCEFDGPRTRSLHVHISGDPS